MLQLLLLAHGQIAYWGPLREAMPYFERLGFRCPSEYSEAEFLASVVERPQDFLAGVVAHRYSINENANHTVYFPTRRGVAV